MNRFSIAWITMGFSLGIILGYWSLFWVVFGFVALLILAGCFKANLFLRLFIFGIIVLFGFFYFQLKESWQKENLKLNAYEHEVELIGTIDSDLKQRKGLNSAVASFELKLERINDDGWKNSFGRVLVNIYQDDFDAFYGDRIYLVGNLSRPYNFSPGSNFSYVQYLSRQRIYHIVHVKKSQSVEVLESGQAFSLRLFSLKLRNQLKRVYEKYLSAQDAAMMNAFLLGDRSQVGGLTKQVFVETGTAHIWLSAE